MTKTIKIGSRKSKLALWQSKTVAEMLNQRGVATRIIPMDTRGDKVLDTPIAEIGSKGVFTEEIEACLANGDIDMAVHSAKDMPSRLPGGFSLVAFTRREKAHDVLVGTDASLSLGDRRHPLCVGTSSVRRTALLKHFYPHAATVDIRGNLQTRIKKMKGGACDVLMLAYAGVTRMGYDDLIIGHMPINDFVPPVGQGSMAVEVVDAIDPELKDRIRTCVNHIPTEQALCAERAFLNELHGGCSIPAFAYAESTANTVGLNAGIISLDGREMIRESISGDMEKAAALGRQVGRRILDAGGREILEDIQGNQKH